MNSGVMHTDPFAGMMAASAIMIALHHRARTGEGQEIDLSQQETSIGLIADRVMEYSMNRSGLDRRGNLSSRMAPHNNYRCTGDDSWVAIAVRTDDEWQRLCAVMNTPTLAHDPRFLDLHRRLENVASLDALVSAWTEDKDAYEITQLLQAEGIPSAPVLKATELADNPQLRERGFIQSIDHPETGTQKYAGVAWKLSRTPGSLGVPSPRLGQHSVEVLRDYLGRSVEDIDRMVSHGITGDTPDLDA